MKFRIKARDNVFHHEASTDIVTIGRSSENDFVIPFEDFSRKHCQITIKGEYLFIMDLGSKNGVMVDRKKIPPNIQVPVYAGMKVILANHFELILFETDLNQKKKETILNLNLEELPLKRK